MLAITAVCLYLVFPSLVEVFSSWPKLVDLKPWWLLPMALLELCSFACTVGTPADLPLRTKLWRDVILAHLAGNAFSRIVPGGAVAGAAVPVPDADDAGIPSGRVASGLATTNVLTFSALLALPVLSLPAILLGVPVDRGLANAAWFGAPARLDRGPRRREVAFDRPMSRRPRRAGRTQPCVPQAPRPRPSRAPAASARPDQGRPRRPLALGAACCIWLVALRLRVAPAGAGGYRRGPSPRWSSSRTRAASRSA